MNPEGIKFTGNDAEFRSEALKKARAVTEKTQEKSLIVNNDQEKHPLRNFIRNLPVLNHFLGNK